MESHKKGFLDRCSTRHDYPPLRGVYRSPRRYPPNLGRPKNAQFIAQRASCLSGFAADRPNSPREESGGTGGRDDLLVARPH
ncbi:MAG: hypothetical protein ACUVTH_03175 [Thermogutta sp.]